MNFIQYFYPVAFFILFAAALSGFVFFWRKIKTDFAIKALCRCILKQQKLMEAPLYFSTDFIKKAVRRHSSNWDTEKFSEDEKLLFFHPEKFLKNLKSQKKNFDLIVLEAELLFLVQKSDKAENLLAFLEEKKLSRYAKAKKFYLEAFFALREGDLLTASEKASSANKIFQLENAYYEEAETHLLLGTIYRISAVYDTAYLMFKTAADIFTQLGAAHRKATVLGNMGMLAAAQENFTDAEAYFTEAEDIFFDLNRKTEKAEITNQRALTFLLSGQAEKTLTLLKKARFSGKGKKYAVFAGLNYELESRAYVFQKKWKQASVAAAKAQKFYKESKNISGLLEAQMLQAQAVFELDDDQKAEDICRQAIRLSEKKTSCFHIANAYSLLGLVFLKRGDLQRSKLFFKQSLAQETFNNRQTGMAVDCANLAYLEKLSGHTNESCELMQKALEYAKTFGENDLYDMLKKTNESSYRP